MSNIPSFKVNSKPTLSEVEVNAHKKDQSKFLSEPGTYAMVIKAVDFAQASVKDSAWLGTNITLETVDGKNIKYYLMIPTECRNSYLFGADKQTFAIDKLRAFFRGLGLVFDFENGMEQVAAIFGDTNKIIGKTLNVRLGYEGPHAKYVGPEEYVLVEKDHVTKKLEGSFPNKEALNAACREAGIKRVLSAKGYANADFIGVAEIFASSEPLVNLEASASVDADLPF